MSHLVSANHVKQYNENVTFLSQQKSTKLRDKVEVVDLKGKKGAYDALGPTKPTKRTGRHGDTKLVNTPHYRRWITSATYDWADLVDDEDKLKMLYDPTHPYAVNAGMAFARQKDDVIISALFADVLYGEDGDQTLTWASDGADQIIAETGTDGMTLAKLLEAQEIKGLADVDEDEKWYMAISPKQLTNLLNTTEVKSADYNSVKALVKGEINEFMGFEFVRTNRLLTTGNMRRCAAWCKSGLYLAEPKNVTTDIGPRRDKNNATQIFVTMNLGAVRMEEVKVIEIQCYEAPAA